MLGSDLQLRNFAMLFLDYLSKISTLAASVTGTTLECWHSLFCL